MLINKAALFCKMIKALNKQSREFLKKFLIQIVHKHKRYNSVTKRLPFFQRNAFCNKVNSE